MSESLSSNDKMEEPEQIDELEDLKTKFVTITPDQMKSIENRKLSTQYGTDTIHYNWLDLTCEAKVEEIKRYRHGGYANVVLYKYKKDGRMFIVKKNRKNSCGESVTANEIKQMRKIQSDCVIRCYGYSIRGYR